jgi:hypothetical protein
MKKETNIKIIKEFLNNHHPGSKLLSNYKNSKTKITIKCNKNHIFNITWNKLKQGRWCRYCWKNKLTKEEDLIEYINEHHPGSKLLSKYKNSHYKVNILCEKKHIFETTFSRIKTGAWCKRCIAFFPNIDYVKNFVKEKYNGECLSEIYIKCCNKLIFKCENNHIFKKTWESVKNNNSWCLECKGIKIPTIEFINEFVKNEFDGYCLEKQYVNSNHNMMFKCKNNHIFTSKWTYIYNSKVWCQRCSGRQVSIIDINNFVKEKHNGKCLSKKYKSIKEKLLFKCKNNHKFESSWDSIKHGKWCSKCRGGVKKSLNEICEYVKVMYNGECLNKQYKNKDSELLFKCENEHIFNKSWSKVRKGTWCNECRLHIGEEYCRYFFEKKFNKKFPKKRPKWLINKNGNRLELDGFCEELNMAFEYNGRQHYEIVEHFKYNQKKLDKRQEIDKIKIEICKKKNIKLYIIPQFRGKFKRDNLEDFINNYEF